MLASVSRGRYILGKKECDNIASCNFFVSLKPLIIVSLQFFLMLMIETFFGDMKCYFGAWALHRYFTLFFQVPIC